jgi:predicted nucleic acid-binding protein
MGTLALPASGLIYVDAQIVIYSTDQHPVYASLCLPMWQPEVTTVSSELVLLETLVGPLRSGDAGLAAARENLWLQPNATLIPISQSILREAARLRASIPGLKSPDAIHAATALQLSCALFVTNDTGFRRVPGLPIALLDDLLAKP